MLGVTLFEKFSNVSPTEMSNLGQWPSSLLPRGPVRILSQSLFHCVVVAVYLCRALPTL